MSKIRTNIIDAEWSYCLGQSRDARALVLRNAESFHESAVALERIGQVLCGKVRNGLGAYEKELLELAMTADASSPDHVARLFDTVREARNMAVHEGAWARHLCSRLLEFFIILEQAIMGKMKCANDLMVRNPLVAETWQMLAHIRQAILANAFSSLPMLKDGRWYIINDLMIMRYLHESANDKIQKERLSKSLGTVIDEGGFVPLEATCFAPETKIVDLVGATSNGLILITDDSSTPPRLLGILTPFDLL